MRTVLSNTLLRPRSFAWMSSRNFSHSTLMKEEISKFEASGLSEDAEDAVLEVGDDVQFRIFRGRITDVKLDSRGNVSRSWYYIPLEPVY